MKHWAIAGFLFFALLQRSAAMDEDFGSIIKQFAKNRLALDNQLSKQLKLPIPAAVSNFFKVVEAGDWLSVTNTFKSSDYLPGLIPNSIPELQNELYAPVHETSGICNVFESWKRDSSLLRMFCDPILTAMQGGSIYFGGTDEGRFVITAATAVRSLPKVFCLTQNAMADHRYMTHLQAIYGKDIWIPSTNDSMRAFQQFSDEAKRANDGHTFTPDGRIVISGVGDVMAINGILCRMIFDHNKDKHEFFLEESYIIPWMYPYLVPSGSIMKLNKEPLEKLPEAVVEKDKAFWADLTNQLLKHPRWGTNEAAQFAFGKLRCGIAGLYQYRKMYQDAEAAYRQAIQLSPTSAEPTSRLASMYKALGRTSDAHEVVKKLMEVAPSQSEFAKKLLKALDDKR